MGVVNGKGRACAALFLTAFVWHDLMCGAGYEPIPMGYGSSALEPGRSRSRVRERRIVAAGETPGMPSAATESLCLLLESAAAQAMRRQHELPHADMAAAERAGRQTLAALPAYMIAGKLGAAGASPRAGDLPAPAPGEHSREASERFDPRSSHTGTMPASKPVNKIKLRLANQNHVLVKGMLICFAAILFNNGKARVASSSAMINAKRATSNDSLKN